MFCFNINLPGPDNRCIADHVLSFVFITVNNRQSTPPSTVIVTLIPRFEPHRLHNVVRFSAWE